MTKERDNGNNRINIHGENEMTTFQKHNEFMFKFRKSHTNIVLVNEPRLDDAAMIGGMEPLQLDHNMDETGGSAKLDGTYFQAGLLSMAEIRQYKLSQN